jgi:hypothetical protein
MADAAPEYLDLGTAGAGARRELERRRPKPEAKTREDHPHIGGLLLKLKAPPQSEKAWEIGAAAEEDVAAHVRADCPDVRGGSLGVSRSEPSDPTLGHDVGQSEARPPARSWPIQAFAEFVVLPSIVLPLFGG